MNAKNAHLYLPLVQALVDGKSVEHNEGTCADPDWKSRTVYSFEDPIEKYRIKDKPEPPKRIPLGPEVLTPGCALRFRGGGGWTTVLASTESGMFATVNLDGCISMGEWSKWTDEQLEKLEILRPGQTEWTPCSKEA